MYKFIRLENAAGAATITLNRPEVYNALNDEITYELQDAVKTSAKDPAVRVVIITGEGKAFCSGQDLKATVGVENRSFKQSLEKRYNPLILGLQQMPKPVIARLNGVAAGAGCSLALACDIIVASEEATLIEVFVNIGLVPDSGSSYFLPRMAGRVRAFEWSTMGTRIKAREALDAGLVNKVVPQDLLDAAVKEYVDYFVQAPTRAIGLIKRMLSKSGGFTLEQALEYEAYCQEVAGATSDYREGVSAFLEKRKPTFTGR